MTDTPTYPPAAQHGTRRHTIPKGSSPSIQRFSSTDLTLCGMAKVLRDGGAFTAQRSWTYGLRHRGAALAASSYDSVEGTSSFSHVKGRRSTRSPLGAKTSNSEDSTSHAHPGRARSGG